MAVYIVPSRCRSRRPAEEPDLALVRVVDCRLNLKTCCNVGRFWGAFALLVSSAILSAISQRSDLSP